MLFIFIKNLMNYNLNMNFDIFTTNSVNLFVVIRIVTTMSHENLNLTLNQRQQKIKLILQIINKETTIF